MTLIDFQRWLNTKGANIVADGLAGPATRAAILSVFANRSADAIDRSGINGMATRLDIPVQNLLAIATVESGGSAFLNSGHPKILWERHWFWRKTAGAFGVTGWSNPNPGGYTNDADRDGVNDSWQKLAAAACKNPVAAFESASWGKFQIMGFHAVGLGWPNAIEMAYAMSRGELAHYRALVAFLQVNDLVGAARALSSDPETCREFARRYNGPGYRKFDYHVKLARAMS